MKIAEALRPLMESLSITYKGQTKGVNYDYGDQTELIKWIITKGNKQKYPLIWFVIRKEHENSGWDIGPVTLVLLQNTKIPYLNRTRKAVTYDGILYPLSDKITKALNRNVYIDVISGKAGDRYEFEDIPAYGLSKNDMNRSENDFTSDKIYNKKSAGVDWVDARTIDCKVRINANCVQESIY